MEVVWQRCAGIDIGKRVAAVCVRVQGQGGRKTRVQVTTWPATTAGITKLRAKLVAEGVERVVMESTGDYWRPFFYLLSKQVDTALVRASDVKAVPGRKSDVSDAEWIGFAPGSYESAGKRRSVPTRPGNRYAKRALGMAAKSAIRTKDTFLAARFKRLCSRRGYPKALVATAHSMVTAAWHVLSTHQPYHDLGADYYRRKVQDRVIRREIADLEAGGYTVTKAA